MVRNVNWEIRSGGNLICCSTFILLFFMFSPAESQTDLKIDSVTKARIDSIPMDSNKLFSEIPELKPLMDSVFASYFENRGKSFQWQRFRYPLKLNRKLFDLKLKKNKEASRNKGYSSPKEEGDSAISADREIEIELFKGETVVLVCDTIMYDGLVGRNIWKGHVKNSKGSEARISFDRPCPDACLQGAAPDGYAFQDQTFNNCWNTIMYSRTVFSACAEREDMFAGIRYFSNPNVNHPTKGVPLGIDHNTNPANSSNNARVLREVTRNIVARWRDNSLSGLTLSYNGAFPTNTKMTVAGDGDVHLKGNATVGSNFSGLRFSYNTAGMASVDQNGNLISSGYLENQNSHPTNALRFVDGSGQVVKSIGTDGKVRSRALVDINSIP